MKRLILLLVIGAIVFVLSFACTTDEKQQTKPEEGDSIAQETLKMTGDSSSQEVTDSMMKEAEDSLNGDDEEEAGDLDK